MAQKDIFPVTGPAAAGQILPFYLAGENGDGALIRGRLASVGGPASSILARHGYPEMVASLQAEALAIAACLSTFMKFDGVFTLQAKGNGFVKTLLADVTSDGALRALGPRSEAVVHRLVLLPVVRRRGHRRELAVKRAEEAVRTLQTVQRQWRRLDLGARLGERGLSRRVAVGVGEAKVGVAREECTRSLKARAHHSFASAQPQRRLIPAVDSRVASAVLR